MAKCEIALVGERDLSKRAHVAIEASIALFRRDVDPMLTFRWVPTIAVTANTEQALGFATGVWCTPGSPYESTEGALRAIRWAREKRCAFLGTCGGFQHALMEFCQTVLGHAGVHQEMDAEAADPLIAKLACSLVGAKATVRVVPGSGFGELLGGDESMEEFNCNYGLAPAFESVFANSAMKFMARDEAGQVRALRLSGHPFFVGTLFQPERRAFSGGLHPLVTAFFRHASASLRKNGK